MNGDYRVELQLQENPLKDNEFCLIEFLISHIEESGVKAEGKLCFRGSSRDMSATLSLLFTALKLPKNNKGLDIITLALTDYLGRD